MTDKKIGTLLESKVAHVIVEAQSGKPGFGWELKEETRREIEELEDNVRNAEHKSGMLMAR